MVLLINLIPLIIVLCGAYIFYVGYKTGKKGAALTIIAACTAFSLFVYMKAQPSYMPKGDIQRSPIPEFVAPKAAEIQDRNLKPVPQMERRAQQEQQYRDGPASVKGDQ